MEKIGMRTGRHGEGGGAGEGTMDKFKQSVFQYFEKIVVGLILLTALAGTYYVEEKAFILHFYHLPLLVLSYLLGRRLGLLTSVLSILVVLLSALLWPEKFLRARILGKASPSCPLLGESSRKGYPLSWPTINIS
jgi:hypothetical protein